MVMATMAMRRHPHFIKDATVRFSLLLTRHITNKLPKSYISGPRPSSLSYLLATLLYISTR